MFSLEVSVRSRLRVTVTKRIYSVHLVLAGGAYLDFKPQHKIIAHQVRGET